MNISTELKPTSMRLTLFPSHLNRKKKKIEKKEKKKKSNFLVQYFDAVLK